MRANNLNLYRNANEAQTIGNTNPVNTAGISDKLLQAASPAAFNLLNNTKIDKNSSDAAAAACRSYKDISGLRKMAKDQVNKTYYDPRCGWRYKPSTGLYPEISQGALGTASGPTLGQAGSPDEVAGGTQWFWNLEDAEKKISSKICQNASKCKQLSLLGKYADICGYCKSTGAIIPIAGGAARYPNDTTFGCAKKDILSASSTSACPADNFTNFRQGNLNEAFQVREGFGSLDDLNNCMEMPLSRDCVIKVAQNAGCSADGALIQALAGSTGDYDSKLTKNAAYTSYNSFMPFTSGLMKDGSVASITTALSDFGSLVGNTQSGNEKVALAARDLCLRAGEFEKYDFCTEMTNDTIINANNINCIQTIWGNYGGTKQGTQYPTLAKWNGKKFEKFVINGIDKLMEVGSDDKDTNTNAIMGIVGTDTSTKGIRPDIDLPMNEDTRGAETVWFDLTRIEQTGSPIIILRCDLRLKKDTSTTAGPAGEVLPFIQTWTDLINKYNFTNQNNKAYTSAFEIRTPPNDNSVRFGITTDDGFMLSKNQNPFENPRQGADWGSWLFQGPSVYYSPSYTIDKGRPNIFVTKWFQGYGEAASHFWMHRPTTDWVKGANSSDVYLTQEPLAPWMQYELCERPNAEDGYLLGLFEKRWNGPCAMYYDRSPAYGFETKSGSMTYQADPSRIAYMPGRKAYASFVSNSFWHTKAYFHFNAFRTLTLLIRPTANLANGGESSIFHHANLMTNYSGMVLKNIRGEYSVGYRVYADNRQQPYIEHPIQTDEWNLVVIQYVGNDTGVRRITCNVERLANIQTKDGRNSLLAKLNAGRTSAGSVIIGDPRGESILNSGRFMMGAINDSIYPRSGPHSVPSFTGDIAWLHGFRNYLDTDEVLMKEINQKWTSRWPIPNFRVTPPGHASLYEFQTEFNKAGCKKQLTEGDVSWWRKQTWETVLNDMAAYFKLASTCSGSERQHEFCLPQRC